MGENNLGYKKIVAPKKFGSKNFWVQKSLGPKILGTKILGPKILGSKILGSKILGSKILGSKLLGSEIFRVQNVGVQKCWGHFCGWAVKTGIVHWVTYSHYYSFQAYTMWVFQPNSLYNIKI